MDLHRPLDVTCVAVSQFMSVYSALAVWMVSAIQHFHVWLPSVFHDHRWLMLVPYILALAIFVSRHEVVRYLTDSSNPVTALSSHHYSVKISMYEKAELIKSYRIVPFHFLSSHFIFFPPISFGVPSISLSAIICSPLPPVRFPHRVPRSLFPCLCRSPQPNPNFQALP